MIFQILSNETLSIQQRLLQLLLLPLIILISLSLHECAHGYVSYILGDPTAKRAGRLTLDPRKHLDPFGTLLMFFCGFGWAKPVPVNPRYYKNPKKGMALTALAGPVVNLLIGVSVLVWFTVLFWLQETELIKVLPFFRDIPENVYLFLNYTFYIVFYYNLLLAVFNLLPIPPLDGSRIMLSFLPDNTYFGIMRYERIIMFIMFFLLWSGAFTGVFEKAVDAIIILVSTPVMRMLEFVHGLIL